MSISHPDVDYDDHHNNHHWNGDPSDANQISFFVLVTRQVQIQEKYFQSAILMNGDNEYDLAKMPRLIPIQLHIKRTMAIQPF